MRDGDRGNVPAPLMHLFMGSAPGTRRMDQPETLQSEEDRRRPQDGDRRRGDQRSPEEDRRRTAEERSPEEDRKRSPEEDRRRRAEEERSPEEQRRRSPEEERSRLIHVKAYQGQTSRAGGPMLDGSPEHSSTIKRQRYGYADKDNTCETLILKASCSILFMKSIY